MKRQVLLALLAGLGVVAFAIGGGAVALWGGIALWTPAVCSLLIGVVARFALPFQARPFAMAFGLQGGHAAGLMIAYALATRSAGDIALDVISSLFVLIYMVRRPGGVSAIVSASVQVLGQFSIAQTWATGQSRFVEHLLTIDALFRLLALIALAIGHYWYVQLATRHIQAVTGDERYVHDSILASAALPSTPRSVVVDENALSLSSTSVLTAPVTMRYTFELRALTALVICALLATGYVALFDGMALRRRSVTQTALLLGIVELGMLLAKVTFGRLTLNRAGITYSDLFTWHLPWDEITRIDFDSVLSFAVITTRDRRKFRVPRGMDGAFFLDGLLRQIQFAPSRFGRDAALNPDAPGTPVVTSPPPDLRRPDTEKRPATSKS